MNSQAESELSLPEEFHEFYRQAFGDRWSAILKALQEKEVQVRRWNSFTTGEPSQALAFDGLPGCYPFDKQELTRDEHNLLQFYVMDPASVIAARALEVQTGDQVLDLCAAPGGKSLILVEALRESGDLVANEMSQTRRERLKKVIQQYVPRDVRDRVRVAGLEGGIFAIRHRGQFNKILLDAPCSGERHLIGKKEEMKNWQVSRSRKLAQRQYALLTACLEAATPEARIVYSTCALSPEENDGVVRRVLEKKSDRVELVTDYVPSLPGEKTELGFRYLPDACGFGPFYFSVLKTKSAEP